MPLECRTPPRLLQGPPLGGTHDGADAAEERRGGGELERQPEEEAAGTPSGGAGGGGVPRGPLPDGAHPCDPRRPAVDEHELAMALHDIAEEEELDLEP